MPTTTVPAAAETTKNRRFYVFKCDLFDRIELRANRDVLRRLSFAVSSKQTIGKGLEMVRVSPFKTVFVIDESGGASIFAITQNPAFEAEAKRKRPKPDPPPDPPPPVDPLCCASAGCPDDDCVVTDIDCFCVHFPDGQDQDRTTFAPDDALESMLSIL